MKKSIIICEGKKDAILLSYYLGKTYGWNSINTKEGKEYIKANPDLKTALKVKLAINNDQQSWEWYYSETSLLAIYASGTNSNISDDFEQLLNLNENASDEPFDKIVIITDRDDEYVEKNICNNLTDICQKYSVTLSEKFKNNSWCPASYQKEGEEKILSILLMVIPNDELGTMETFLLNCISGKNDGEKQLVNKCKEFVGSAKQIDYVKEKYLKERGITPKAEFAAYFAIASPNRTFDSGDKILKSVPWEKYADMQKAFLLFKEL